MSGRGEFAEQVKETINATLAQVHTCVPGKIVSFDGSTCQATVLPAMKIKTPKGEMKDYPQITGVPVVFPQSSAQGATIAYPVKAGDGCLILFAEQALDKFLYDRDTGTDLKFDLSNAVAIVGIFAKGNSVMAEATSSNAVIVDVKGTRVKVQSGLVQIDAAAVKINGNVTITGDLTVTGGVVNLN